MGESTCICKSGCPPAPSDSDLSLAALPDLVPAFFPVGVLPNCCTVFLDPAAVYLPGVLPDPDAVTVLLDY